MAEKMNFGRYSVEVSKRDKVLFPCSGITKGDLVDYYRHIAEVMLPHMKGRPLMMHRYPDGIAEEGFYQKEASDHFPGWIKKVKVKAVQGKTVNHVVCENTATLVYLAQEATITPHAWLSREGKLHYPDKMIFDLDPPDDDFEIVRSTALDFRDLLDEAGLASYVMTTGSRGLHVVIPLDGESDFNEVRAVARGLARTLEGRRPDKLTTAQYKSKRKGRLYLDTNRNAYGQTGVVPYAVRAKEKAPVATPLQWPELTGGDLGPRSYNMANIFRRLGQRDDPWRDMYRHARGLAKVRDRLETGD
jgi:bifunctional non-homologous end joining protein LigD